MFEDPNPEMKSQKVIEGSAQQGGKNKLLKLQVIYNVKELPTGVHEINITQKFWPTLTYQRDFAFDKLSRVVASQMDDDITGNPSAALEAVSKSCTLDSCLAQMGQNDLL